MAKNEVKLAVVSGAKKDSGTDNRTDNRTGNKTDNGAGSRTGSRTGIGQSAGVPGGNRTGRRRFQRGTADFFQQERVACAQALLNRPWISKEDDPELFQAIKQHYEELRSFFQEYCDLVLIVTRYMAKLDKYPTVAHPWMGFEEFTHCRDYTLFAFCLWYLEGKGELEQFLLTDMIEEIRDYLAGVDRDIDIDWNVYDHRLSMARALRKLRDLSIVTAVDGDETEWSRSGNGEHNVLYECGRAQSFLLRRFPRDLTTYTSIASLGEGDYADTDEGRVRRRRHRVFRRLIQEPVVYDGDWTDDERQYVLTQRRYLLEALEKHLGLTGQRYREGLLVFHPELSGEALLFPTGKAISDIAVLFAGELRRRRAQGKPVGYDEGGRLIVTCQEVETVLHHLRERHGRLWGKTQREAKLRDLMQELFDHLSEWNLGGVVDDMHRWVGPALGRFIGDYQADFDE
ncbi:TIGR02678 family protein [Heliophilum fasciatum]|uniref:Uncharacterized protein (TIGR02678 family) n=1 Tax=Heliophilum fasciatum TaxID=35700 RepID=A0A4R2RPI0_9FIRM|nr:TIGR02678 family protein [Heliophilum fasciatum]MCW2277667.1 uncharacterized protein (TIGR02678 family) [Heliophilum fasciatum]TCP65014.1 uncharacterized protein (TIGR02678 family) [Heliophilum fasciatum]